MEKTSPSAPLADVPPLPAVLWMLLAGIAFTVMAMAVGGLSSSLSESNLLFYRSLGHLGLIAPVLLFRRENPLRSVSRWVLLRSITSFLGVSCFFVSLHFLSPALSTLIQWTAPAFTFIFAIVFYREKVLPSSLLKLLGVAAGLLLVVGPQFNSAAPIDGLHLVIGLGGAALAGVSYCLLQKIGTQASEEKLAFWLSATGIILICLWNGRHLEIPARQDFPGLALVSLCVAIYQYSVTRAYRLSRPTLIAPFSLLPVILTMAVESISARHLPATTSMLGAGVILVSLISLQLRKKVQMPIIKLGVPTSEAKAA